MGVKSTWIPTWHQMDHVSWSLGLFFLKPPLGGRFYAKPADHGTPNTHNCWFIQLYRVRGPAWKEIRWNSIWSRARSHMPSRYAWGPWPHYKILEVCWDGLWTVYFGLSQFHGHGSWLVCGVALSLHWWLGAKDPFCTHHKQKERHIRSELVLCVKKRVKMTKISLMWKYTKKIAHQTKCLLNHYLSTISHNCGQTMLYLIICQLLTSKIHNNFNLKNTITKQITVLLIFIFLHQIFLHHLILL